MLQILAGVVYDDLEGLDFVGFMVLIVADPTNHAVLDALGLDADQAERLSCVELSLLALRIFEGLARGTHLINMYLCNILYISLKICSN